MQKGKNNSKCKRNYIEGAREFRPPPAPAEAAFWRHLRHQQLGGYKFRRQQRIDRFIFPSPACGRGG